MRVVLHFAQHTLQEVALFVMAVVYLLRLRWLLSFKPGRDRQRPTGGGEGRSGGLYSLGTIAMPWVMESTRTNPFFYAQFVVFHLAATAAILLSFVIPYAPGLLEVRPVTGLFQLFIGMGFLVGCLRLVRRVTQRTMRALSSPDDYFSLILLTVWLASAFLAAPNDPAGGEGALLAFFFLTAFFLLYVPFSKISHYLYYPFTRYYLGRTLGHRGVFPPRRGPSVSSSI